MVDEGKAGTDTGTKQGTGTQRTSSRVGTRNTSVSFNDAWHMEGRRGAHTGKTWGDWELGGLLGEGGMGAVYRAKQTSLKRRVAIKVLSPALAADTKLLQRFQLEARMTSMLSSPNLVQVFAAGEWDGDHFFVMEYVDGTDLYQVIKDRQAAKTPFKPDEAADIVLQAARGLAEAGRYGMVHRDIKPANLMVTRQGLVKVADFGIVKVMGEASLTLTGQAVGTPSYVSPEQGRGHADIDQRADFYSLGVVFYELLCGKKPFEATTPNALIYQHCYAEPELPRALNPDISDAYQAVVLKCLQKKPENRYQTAEELIKDIDGIRTGNLLQSALANYRVGTGAEEAQRENLSWAQRHLLQLVLSVALVLILIGFGGFAYVKHYTESSRHASELQRGLSLLDSPQAIPRGADQDLEIYASLPGADQSKVLRWRDKLKRVAALRSSLSRLDGDHVSGDVRFAAPTDLKVYQELVGVQEPQGIDWRRKLERLQVHEDEVRENLRLLDQKTDLTEAEYQALLPKLDDLANLSSADDPQVIRCRKRLTDYNQLKQDCRNRLASLDRPGIVLNDQQLLHLQGDLSTLELMLGKQDDDIQRWARLLISSSQQVAKLRSRLRQLDSIELPPVSMQRDLDKDLAAIQQLVDKDDPELRGWIAKIAASNAEMESLRKRLRPIDAIDCLRPKQIVECASWLTALTHLAGDSDQELLRWSAKVANSQAQIEQRRAMLRRLDKPEELTSGEQVHVREAMTLLEQLGALSPEEHASILHRLKHDQDLMDARHLRLTALDRPTTITNSLKLDLTSYVRQMPADDVDARRWMAKEGIVDSMLAGLISLDGPKPLPSDCSERLAKLASLVGADDPTVVRWQGKLVRVAQLRQSLGRVDVVQPLFASADAELKELASLIGEDATDYRRWRDKTDEVLSLRQNLSQLSSSAVLSIDASHLAHQRCDRLTSLVGHDDGDLQRWVLRLVELDGPGLPFWAAAYGHDQFGPYAQSSLLGIAAKFRFVPSGHFMIGSPQQEAGRDGDERQVMVTISKGYWLAETECTQALWYAVTGHNPSRDQGREFPVERVSWIDCSHFLTELNHRIGHGFSARLPTEAEWEYACRAGSDAAFSSSRSDQPSLETTAEEMAWFDRNANGQSHEVKQRVPNPLGLYDIQGNVDEWCIDHFCPYPTVASVDPIGIDGDMVVLRGGSWGDPLSALRAANRIAARPEMRSAYVGLRLAIDASIQAGGSAIEQVQTTTTQANIVTPTTNPLPAPNTTTKSSGVPGNKVLFRPPLKPLPFHQPTSLRPSAGLPIEAGGVSNATTSPAHDASHHP